jgi:hypothetical protein
MGSYLPLIFVTFIYLSLFIYFIAATQVEALREDWNSVRCQPMAMMFASYIPTDPNVDRSKFSHDNFQFCIQELIDASIGMVMVPIMGIFSTQLSAAKSTQQSANTMRTSAASGIAKPFNALINFAWKRFGYILAQIMRVMYKMNSSFQRIFGITLASVFAGISVFKSINNTIKLILKVCIILLSIIIALLFLIFIPIAPFIAIFLIPTIIFISQMQGADKVGGMQGALNNCVKKGTKVKCGDGWKSVEDICIGERLWEGTVKGILYGKGSASVSIHSVHISELHIVLSPSSRWIFAKDHPDAIPCETPDVVYSLVTSSGTWTVKVDEAELFLRDWTHADGNDELIQRKVCSLLQTPFAGIKGMGLLGPETSVLCAPSNSSPARSIRLESLRLGDKIWDGEEFTEVTSIYRSSELGNTSGPNSSAWSRGASGWVQSPVSASGKQVPQIHCATKSGRLVADGMLIRDFNEIDKEHFHELEEFLLSLL